jgi:hypothetical protein
MVQLEVLSGKRAGAVAVARRFPFVVGRDGSSDLDLQMPDGFALKVLSQARAAVNDQPVQQAVILRNGDVIGIGAVKIRFWLGETRQLGLQMREFLTWAALVMLCAGQIALIYRLLP